MNKSRVAAFVRSRYTVAIAAGILLALSFPLPGIAGLAWIAPALLLGVCAGTTPKTSFRLGVVGGLAWHLIALRWLLLIPVTGFPILGWIALCSFLALFQASWMWLASTLLLAFHSRSSLATSNPPPATDSSPREARHASLAIVSSLTWMQRVAWTLACAVFWVALEFVQGWFLGGFPWNPLAASQQSVLPLIQIASITGVHGVSFLMIWCSAAMICAAARIVSKPAGGSAWLADMFLPLLAVAVCCAFGVRELSRPGPQGSPIRITMIQPSIPQTLIWSRDNADEWFRDLLKLTDDALAEPTDLLLWPESAVPGMLRYDVSILTAVTNIAARHNVWMIVASDDAELPPNSKDPKDALYFNSCFLVGPGGQVLERYNKRSLVIFGEYIPLEHVLPIVKWLTPIQGSFTPGTEPVPFHMELQDGRNVNTSPLICFEDVFPGLGREGARTNTDFLVNLTNDGWFGESAAQWQQAATAAFRSIENRLPLVRCTNTGLTCWIDAQGRYHDILRDAQGRIYGAGWIRVEVPLTAPDEMRGRTFYNRYGDWLGWGCELLTGLAVVLALARRKIPSP